MTSNDHCLESNTNETIQNCAFCHEEFNSEPFRLECGSIICKIHFDCVDSGELYSCCICGKGHVFEETTDLSYKKEILIPKLKKMVSEMKQRLEFYESVSQDPVKFLNSSLMELKEKTQERKDQLKQIVKDHYEESLTKSIPELVETSCLREQCIKLNNFSTELEKFTQYLRTNQNFYVYHVYGHKLRLVNKILERKIQKMKDDILVKILESLSIEKTNIPDLLVETLGTIGIKSTKENILLSKDINGQVKVWDLNKENCLYTINLRQSFEFYLNLFSKEKYLELLFNEEKKPNILLNIYSHLINEAKIDLKHQTISCSKVLKINTIEEKTVNCLLVVTEKAKVVVYDLRKNEREMLALDLVEDSSEVMEACCLDYFNQDLCLPMACGFANGDVALLSISKENQYFDKPESCGEIPQFFKFWLQPHSAPVVYLKFKTFASVSESVEKLMLVSASSDGLVRKWTQICDKNFEFELSQELSCDQFSCCELLNENQIVFGLVNGLVKIKNFDGVQIKEIKAHTERIKSVVSKSSEELITCSEDKFIKVWNHKTGSCVSRFASHFDVIESIELIELNDFRKFVNDKRIEAKISQVSLELSK
ncbi:hypothetical protein BpHYR1_054102 [Brachionus plicatilis]|uniref:Uncharacterized protein n=1 Tax=Brachionus plicatilis TaxID=10195 RepID=A0A3M7QF39_BRAPC|nr:hypothetical protein BpHYR1_054102 [Brachionus plicatilis]